MKGDEALKRNQEYIFEGTVVNVHSQFDNGSGKYILDLPDFEERPLFTITGKPIVSAIQDACNYTEENTIDCGSCRFYKSRNSIL